MLTLQSIMNFETGYKVKYMANGSERNGIVVCVLKGLRTIIVKGENSVYEREISPMDVINVEPVKKFKYNEAEKEFVLNNLHMSAWEIGEKIGRTADSVEAFKYSLGLKKTKIKK